MCGSGQCDIKQAAWSKKPQSWYTDHYQYMLDKCFVEIENCGG